MRIKYMGTADVVTIDKKDTVNGRVPDGIGSTLVWNRANNFVVDTTEAGISDEVVEVLLDNEGDRFKDVTTMKVVPSNLHERLYLGHGKNAPKANLSELQGDVPDDEPDPNKAGPSESDPINTAAPVGGSTSGDAPAKVKR